MAELDGFEVVLGVCGGIAAYKAATLASKLVQAGCGVTVVMTRNARRFVGTMTFEALTGRAVATSMWKARSGKAIAHLSLSEQADLMVVAPATANMLGKLAGGVADDLLSSTLLGAGCPVVLAPAMNTQMWSHPATQRNVGWLREHGYELVGPGDGWQACRAVGPGRMSEAEEIYARVVARLTDGGARKSHRVT